MKAFEFIPKIRPRRIKMKMIPISSAAAFLFFMLAVPPTLAQTQAEVPQYSDPMANISIEMTRVSRNVEELTQQLKSFVDKFEKVGSLNMTEKQQRLILGMELLVRTEQRVTEWQKYQVALVREQSEARAKLAGIEIELHPERLERSTQWEGSTRAPEMRESRRQTLIAERQSLNALMNQIDSSLSEANSVLREAQAMANRLRRTFLPQIEQELYQ